MSGFQNEKNLIRAYYAALDSAVGSQITQVLREFTAKDYTWRPYHPFHLQTDVEQISEQFWQPLRHAVTSIQRRIDVFFAGKNVIDDGQSTWVVSMGHLTGLFDHPWLGIQPTGKMVMLRYAEFHKVENNKITDTAFYFDIPHLMAQAGQSPFANQLGAHNVQPGPQPHNAVLYDDADPLQGQKTINTIHAMINDLGTWQSGLPIEEELARTWNKDMIWWGPAGIGATYTIERYAKQHATPFRAAFTDRSSTGHIARLAEGEYGGFFGWPNFTARPTNGYLGLPPSDKLCEFRVIDIYRRDGDKLAENWVFIDLIHFFDQMGVKLLDTD